jgi:hypothetical protein
MSLLPEWEWTYFDFISQVVIHELVHLMLFELVSLLESLVVILMVSNLPCFLFLSLS